jgi:hypothetical protein
VIRVSSPVAELLLGLHHAVLQVREPGDSHLVGQDGPPRLELNRLGLSAPSPSLAIPSAAFMASRTNRPMAWSRARRRHASTARRTLGSLDHRNAVLRGTSFRRAHAVIDSPRAMAEASWVF